jgi:hypothetical protein
MVRSFPYRLETPFAPAECCERLNHALANQPGVNVAEDWLHRPQVVLGRVSVSEIMLYRGNAMVHSRTPIFFATIVPHGRGSAVVGKFRRHKAQIVFALLLQVFLSSVMLGIPAFVALGVYRDPVVNISPLVATFVFIPVLVFIGIEILIWKRSKISQEEMQIVCNLLDRSLRMPQNGETEQVETQQPLSAALFT